MNINCCMFLVGALLRFDCLWLRNAALRGFNGVARKNANFMRCLNRDGLKVVFLLILGIFCASIVLLRYLNLKK